MAIVVLAGVIERNGAFLLTRRLKGTHLAGTWEFPGGKCEADESHEDCLKRELAEELGVGAEVGEEILTITHAYTERAVELHFRKCSIAGEPRALLGQEVRWVPRGELHTLEFPEADRELIERLRGGTD
jgi:mutator protein MutT